jgi:hypothetical protein
MKLPYKSDGKVPKPSVLDGVSNGKLPADILRPCGIGKFKMVEPAASAMKALVAAAAKDGVVIYATGTYRDYAGQEWAFNGSDKKHWAAPHSGRYVPECLWKEYEATGRGWASSSGKQDIRRWVDARWKRRAGTAGSAVPGTSNHGWGLSVDFATMRKGKVASLTVKELTWLAKNGPKFGYWNTVESENWHWSYCLGDEKPAA